MPTQGSYQRFEDLTAETQPPLDRLRALVADQVAAFNAALEAAGVGPVVTHRRQR
jgi:hypothetical protein